MNWFRALLDRAKQSLFDWLEAPGYTKDGKRLYTHHGGDPYAK